MIEKMSAELTNLSSLYSAKCLENLQLDEKMQDLLVDRENNDKIKFEIYLNILNSLIFLLAN